MKRNEQASAKTDDGTALVAVILLTFILLIACVAMLTAVGAGTTNTADILSESKAYYAAESGLQATINVLRNNGTNGLDYKTAVSDPDLSDYLNYCSTGLCSPKRVVFANGGATYDPNVHTAYSVAVSDPDNTALGLTFYTVGGFYDTPSVEVSEDFRTVYIPSSTADPRTEITITDPGSTTVAFPLTSNPALTTLTVTKVGGGVAIPPIDLKIDYHVTAPRTGVRSIRGTIPAVSTASGTIQVNFLSQIYNLLGSTIELCSGSGNDLDGTTAAGFCSTTSLSLSDSTPTGTLYGNITALEPYRLKIDSIGYGPNGAKKMLEGIVQKDFFNGLASGAATTMIGPSSTDFQFDPGNSAQVTYSGGDCSTGPCVPSFGFTDPTNLDDAITNTSTNVTMEPPPALLGDEIPGWQSSPSALDDLIDQLRIAAQNSGRYFVNPSGNDANFCVACSANQPPPGDYDTGTGITFCEGSCKMGRDGGGILVVTGKLTNVTGWDFRGMIIVTGEEGWLRNGGGGGQVIGNVIIAPYNLIPYVPENLSSTFLSPRYEIQGGGTSDIIYDDVSATFDGTSAISNIMVGVTEK